jgi:hypothetical protein
MRSGSVPEVWTRQEFAFTSDQRARHEDGEYGVPEEMLHAIADAVLSTLAELNIDPKRVYLSGHNGLEADPDEAKISAQTDEYGLLSLHDINDDENAQDVRDATDYLHRRRARSETPSVPPLYHMSTADKLNDAANLHTNPIHYAGISPRSTIVVYNQGRIDGWPPALLHETPHGFSVATTEAELAAAVLVNIRLRYRLEGYPYEGP